MELNDVLTRLQYKDSPYFLRDGALDSDRDFGHVFRKARDKCKLQGVYVLDGSTFEKSQGTVPVVYVCEANSESEAREIHRKVWNQNVVPFLVVVGRGSIRLYPSFQYERSQSNDAVKGALKVVEDFNQISNQMQSIRADAINSGAIWKDLSKAVTPEKRVDWKLLENLRELDDWLQQDNAEMAISTNRRASHALIGKFVYLNYLRQRDILSDARLAEWEISPQDVFSHTAKLSSFVRLVERVDEWLNGSVFPLSSSKLKEFGAERIRKVASVFQGEHTSSGQLPLFDIYDFSFIPIETLSVIYEQFLHATLHPSGKSEGRVRGAYYTPVPVVNFMLDRLDSRKKLEPGMRILDASCGSGAFLVQCYRKLIERRRDELDGRIKPAELGHLLTNHVFGVDVDEDACQIAELSLALTLLDYVDPPDLTKTKFKLPALRNRNIFHGDAFKDGEWSHETRRGSFDWIVGNPPWKEINPRKLDEEDKQAWQWIQIRKDTHPTGGNQLAEAFTWRTSELLNAQGCAALLLPAMTLFKYESTRFRKSFFAQNQVWSIANFANLADVLFAGRATLPAAAFFFTPRLTTEFAQDISLIETYNPFVVNQLVTGQGVRRQETWSIVVNASELRDVDYQSVANGEALPWKIAMWGSPIDRKVLHTVARRFQSLGQMEEMGDLLLSEGLQLRDNDASGREALERHDELSNKATLNVDVLKNRRFLFRFPPDSLTKIPASQTSVRKGRFKLPIRICRPPHVIVGASRNFAVYSEEFLVVPARQIAIATPTGNRDFLKALALYLNSDFVTYQQFLTTTQAGIQKSINTLKALRNLPLPFMADSDLSQWGNLHARIEDQCRSVDDFDKTSFVRELNELVSDSLKLSFRARAAVKDLVQIRMGLTRGKIPASLVKPASADEQHDYATMLRDDLDAFVGLSGPTRHKVSILFGEGSGLVTIDMITGTTNRQLVEIVPASDPGARVLEEARSNLLEQRAQWLYFNRNLREYSQGKTLILKPVQRLHWTKSQAMQDAAEIIAESLVVQPEPHEWN